MGLLILYWNTKLGCHHVYSGIAIRISYGMKLKRCHKEPHCWWTIINNCRNELWNLCVIRKMFAVLYFVEEWARSVETNLQVAVYTDVATWRVVLVLLCSCVNGTKNYLAKIHALVMCEGIYGCTVRGI